MASQGSAPPIVLVHGLWLTPRSWEAWKERFERRSGHLQQFGDAALCDAGSRSGRGSIARTEARQTPASSWRSERRAVLAQTSARRPLHKCDAGGWLALGLLGEQAWLAAPHRGTGPLRSVAVYPGSA